MHFETFADFIEMGGYGFFVWLAFGVSFLALALVYIESIVAKRKLFTFAQQEFARKQRIKAVRKQKKAAAVQTDNQEVTQ